nr:MAG TPA: hypothetical protein [Crassvirales sp.]
MLILVGIMIFQNNPISTREGVLSSLCTLLFLI